MTMGDGTGDVDRTREEIDRRRAELGETVQALAAKTDIRARGRQQAGQATDRLRERSTQATGTVREKAAHLPGVVSQKVGQAQRRVGQMAADAGQQGARGAQVVGASVNRAGGIVRHNPVPFALGAVAMIAGVVIGRKRMEVARARRRSGQWNADRLLRMAQPMAPWRSAAIRSVKRFSGSRRISR
ncbi:DUF3618 domain-containing protein [Plantactinospora sp. KLBMP9567]|uniref:DUF3618 domain-containing protein n=1 Tax=Plantactinospora sp. KLBMP9567 TaxID=3085900 RepID=UPI002982A35C|nr:DUF3618 domain-containing protein [Plantactinospora sp. KLBMP9567]MDW5330725.1 DUF3618 domain-containing protein [Plantactinospora sp. KLBMP9567]